ncbi:MAG TPA: hypothetical protein VGT44_11175 [Ktedonobacteraceae bacterium]|nr:hypothetical protein [Ktedonobacteraceae bacterium]
MDKQQAMLQNGQGDGKSARAMASIAPTINSREKRTNEGRVDACHRPGLKALARHHTFLLPYVLAVQRSCGVWATRLIWYTDRSTTLLALL